MRVDQCTRHVPVERVAHAEDLAGSERDTQGGGGGLVPGGHPQDVIVVTVAIAIHIDGIRQAVLVRVDIDHRIGDCGDERQIAVVRWRFVAVARSVADDRLGTQPRFGDQRVPPVPVVSRGSLVRRGVDDGHPPEHVR